jgi:uncharacterized protein (DUF849 family)
MALKTARRGRIPPFIVMDVMRAANELAAGGADVLHLEVGQPSTGAPAGVLDAARRALDGDVLGYTDALGLPTLRSAIARYYGDRYGIDLDPRSTSSPSNCQRAPVIAIRRRSIWCGGTAATSMVSSSPARPTPPARC